jgi:ABC-type amino acid transport substrate-binding protein
VLTPQISTFFRAIISSSICDSYNKIMYRSGGIYTLKKMEEEIDLYFFRCYDEDKYDQRRVKMKKILASLMMVGLIFCLGGCNVPWMKQKTEKTKAAKVIQADKVEGTMKGMKLKVGVSNDMAPFSYYDSEQKKITGFDIDLLDKLSEYLGFEYELYPMNMKKLEQKIKNKELDLAIAGISITDERQREFSFTDTYYETYLQIVVRKDSQITDRKEITEKKVGVVEGTSSAQYAEDYLSEDNKITYYKNITKVWNDLEKGTIDATIYDTTGIQNYMQEHADNTNLSVLNEQLNSEESNYGIMFVKGYKYLDQFNVALQVLNNDGTYQKLKEQWIKTKE